MKIDLPFNIMDKVLIDEDVSIVGVIVAFTITGMGQQAHVAWLHCGDQRMAWIDLWRLSKWEG